MKLPLFWLKKYIDVRLSPERLAEMLTMSGTKVEHTEKNGGDSVLNLEITTNRPDCLSILGLAREVSALTGRKIKFPKIPVIPAGARKGRCSVTVELDDRKGCPQYTARLLEDVTIRPAPEHAARCLRLMDSRPINNAVDATNFVLFETGQPLHAFDFDKIKGGVVIVRRARKGEKFLALDDKEYTLDEKTLVIADAERVIAMAGVIGGKLTEVTGQTKNILLESAAFDQALVRRAARAYKISTESSTRFERGVDPEGVATASRRAADLIRQWGGGLETCAVAKGSTPKRRAGAVVLREQHTRDLTGLSLSAGRMTSILKRLGFDAKPLAGKVRVLLTPRRKDVTEEPDLIEEVLRIEGFDAVPAVIPTTHHSESVRDEKAEGILELKKFCAAQGFQEIINYSLISAKTLADSGFSDLSGVHRITNASSAEQEYFRPSLLPGMLGALVFNLHRKADSLKFFEVGNRYFQDREETILAFAACGNLEENWTRKKPASFYDLKGVLENVLHFLGINGLEWRAVEDPRLGTNECALFVKGAAVGLVSDIAGDTLARWDIPREVFYAELICEELLTREDYRKRTQVRPVPKFPSVKRDIAFVVDERIPVGELEELMRRTAAPYLSEAFLFDQYGGKNIASGKRSLAFSLAYQKEDGTFTDVEVQGIHERLGQALKDQYQAEIR